MPSLTARLPNLQQTGPLIEVLISPSSALRAILEAGGKSIPQPVRKMMLIDTGASASAIKTGIARELGLTPHGTISISTASHKSHVCLTYDVDLIFSIQRVGVQNVRVFETKFEGQNIDGLIGRDVLRLGVLIYNGYDQSFTLSF